MSFETFKNDFQGKNILIFGLGILGGGEGTVHTFQEFPCQIKLTDKKTEEQLSETLIRIGQKNIVGMTLNGHSKEDIDWADLIVKNPAVPSSHELIKYAIQKQKHVTTDAALYLKYSSNFTIGITGTRGKTTTTMLTHHLVSNGTNRQVLLGGNIKQIGSLPLLSQENENGITILELSSFALEGCHWEKVSPHIAAITNIYPDHFDRYPTIESYIHDKAAIFLYQKANDHVFLNETNEFTNQLKQQASSQIHLLNVQSANTNGFNLPGQHNLWNAIFAISIAKQVGINEESLHSSLASFKGVEYRQQLVGTVNGIEFYNDSTSTTPEAVIAALETFPTATFIIGGTTKNLPLHKLTEALQKSQSRIIFLKGSGTRELLAQIGRESSVYENLPAAFQESIKNNPKQVVFSPGFTSFELFKNEFDRANQFDQLVKNLSR